MGKFALRGLARSMARELAPKGIPVAHFAIDGGVRNAETGCVEAVSAAPDSLLDPDAIASTYMHVVQQPRSAWTREIEMRPWVERFCPGAGLARWRGITGLDTPPSLPWWRTAAARCPALPVGSMRPHPAVKSDPHVPGYAILLWRRFPYGDDLPGRDVTAAQVTRWYPHASSEGATMRSNPWTMVIVAALIVGAVAVGATMFEPKNDAPLEKLGEKIDKIAK